MGLVETHASPTIVTAMVFLIGFLTGSLITTVADVTPLQEEGGSQGIVDTLQTNWMWISFGVIVLLAVVVAVYAMQTGRMKVR